jgi:bifunctional enzyme CysN/CysC
MVTGASTADLAIDPGRCAQGVLTQTRRHSFIASLLGIRHVVLAVNKMDLVDYDRGTSTIDIVRRLRASSPPDGHRRIHADPDLALKGDNVTAPSATCLVPGPTLLEHLETVEVDEAIRMQMRRSGFRCSGSTGPNLDSAASRGPSPAAPSVPATGSAWQPSGRKARVAAHRHLRRRSRSRRVAGQSVTLTLADEIDISRGDDDLRPPSPPRSPTSSRPMWCGWRGSAPAGRSYLMKHGTQTRSRRP